jgi:hypothetical protein
MHTPAPARGREVFESMRPSSATTAQGSSALVGTTATKRKRGDEMDAAEAAKKAEKRNKNKFSRQNAAFGAETTSFLSKMKVLVVGLRGTGVEIIKNCLLQGVGSVVLFDPTPVAIADTGANFFLTAEDVGQPRDAVSRPRLQELHPDAKRVPL